MNKGNNNTKENNNIKGIKYIGNQTSGEREGERTHFR